MSKITRREFLRVSAVTLAGAALAACGPKATETEVSPGVTPEAPKEEKPTTFPLGTVPRHRELRYYWNAAPAAGNFNPYPSAYNHQNGNSILYEPCAYYNAQADNWYLWLAESYKPNDTATEWTITFRKGIEWSDGVPFTAADPAWSMETLKRVDGLNRAGTYKSELTKAEAIDDLNLKVTLNQTDWRFFSKSLTFRYDLGDDTAMMPKHVFETIADAELANTKYWDLAKGWPISTGPYGVSESTEQVTNYDLRPSWWAVKTGFEKDWPAPWRIQMTLFTNDTTAAQLLINKEIDQPLDLRPLVVASTIAQADHLDTWSHDKPPYGYTDWWPISVQICTKKPPFDNPKVRWAAAYAINQQKVLETAWFNAGSVAMSPYPAFAKLTKYVDSIKDITDQYNVLEFNLDKTNQLMTEAGFAKNADGWWADKDGNVVDGDLWAGVPLFGDLAPVVSEQLRTAGFKSEHKAPPDVWAGKVDGRASFFLFGHGGSTIDPYDTWMLYVAANAAPMGEQSWSNITRWDDPEFAALRQEMNNTNPEDEAKMMDLFHKGMKIWYEQLPDIPLVQWYHRIPVNTWFFKDWPNMDNPYMNSALWHLTMWIVVRGLKVTGNKA